MTESSVLILDSDPDKSQKIGNTLSESGYTVFTAEFFEDAGDILKNKAIDLIVCDHVLEGVENVDVIKKLRALTDAPIMVCSSRDSINDKEKTYEAGCDDHVSASIDMRELRLRVSSLIRRSMKQSNLLIEFAPVTMNIKTRDVTVAGTPVKLTNREFEILNYLAESPNKTISIQDVYSRVWGNDTPCDSHLVMVNISYIRKKLSKVLPDLDFIHTEWGVGYSFCYPPLQAK